MAEDRSYLQPGFDPNTLRVADLRRILLEHDIDYNPSAKKAQLVDIFNAELVPRAARILGVQSRIKPSGRGITDIAPEISPPPTVKRSGRTRAPQRLSLIAGDLEDHAENKSPTKTPSRRKTSAKHHRDEGAVFVDEQELPPKSIRKTKGASRGGKQQELPEVKDESTPSVKTEDSEAESEPVFTSQNVFQSGASPPVEDRRKSTSKRSSSGYRQPSGQHRRPPPSPVARPQFDNDIQPPSTDHFEISKPITKSPRKVSKPGIRASNRVSSGDIQKINQSLEPGEEFTPEAAEEVAVADAAGPLIRRRRRQPNAGPSLSMNAILTVIATICLAYFTWWRQETIAVGYCHTGPQRIYSGREAQLRENPLLAQLIPDCKPCPKHATCYPSFQAVCQLDYVQQDHPYSFGGLVPLPPKCVKDSDKERRIQILSDEAVRQLRKRSAAVECGDIILKAGEEAGLSEKNLRDILYDLRAPKLSDEQFEDLWRHALEDVESRDEVEVERKDEQGNLLKDTIDGRIFKETKRTTTRPIEREQSTSAQRALPKWDSAVRSERASEDPWSSIEQRLLQR